MTDQCRLALRTILDALPETGRLNARDVQWLRSVALAGLGADPLGAELVTLETVHLRTRLAAVEAERDALVAREDGDDPFAEIVADGLTESQNRYLWRLHKRKKEPNGPDYCAGCREPWPCPMRLALETIETLRLQVDHDARTKESGSE